jgi:hypothetical protein
MMRGMLVRDDNLSVREHDDSGRKKPPGNSKIGRQLGSTLLPDTSDRRFRALDRFLHHTEVGLNMLVETDSALADRLSECERRWPNLFCCRLTGRNDRSAASGTSKMFTSEPGWARRDA